MKYTEFKKQKKLIYKCDESYLEIFKESNSLEIKDNRITVNEDGSYNVHIIGATEKQIFVPCPYCYNVHVHGATKEADGSYGARVPDCKIKNKKAYFIYR